MVAIVREAAAERFDRLELNVIVFDALPARAMEAMAPLVESLAGR